MNHFRPARLHWAPEQMVIVQNLPASLAESGFSLLPMGCQACSPHFPGWRSQPTCRLSGSRFPQRLCCGFLPLSVFSFPSGKPGPAVHSLSVSTYTYVVGRAPFRQRAERERRRTPLSFLRSPYQACPHSRQELRGCGWTRAGLSVSDRQGGHSP